mmetsp:Transcript_19616/g.43666  ORF Transcript_19616/g.43666 Transcript_19616/m.43666 type:complete len:690 (-) Transcript_19616:119-2188(-)
MIARSLSSILILDLLLAGPVLIVSSFSPTLHISNRLFTAHQQRSASMFFSTTESDSEVKTSSGDDDDSHDDEVLKRGILAGLEQFADEFVDAEVLESAAKAQSPPPTAELDVDLVDADFVLVGGKSAMEKDEALKMISSELSIWKNLRKKPLKAETGLPLGIILQRTWDTVEDVWAHVRRIPFEKGWVELSEEAEVTRKTVVVLGSGWAAHALMKVSDCQKLRLIVVSPSNHFVFTPMLASAAVGTVEYRSMTEAVRAANPMIDQYIEGKAEHVNVKEKYVDVKLNSLLDGLREGDPPTIRIDYDHLVVSVGSRVDDRGVPGADKALRLKTCDDARKLRTAVGECLEYASRPDVRGSSPEHVEERTKRATFLIVGGGPTGVELAGELHDLFADVAKEHGAYPNLIGNTKVILAHGGPDLVPQFDEPLRKEALRSLKDKGIEVILNTRVTEVGDGFARLSTKKKDPTTGELRSDQREETMLPLGLTVWCAGTAPVPFVNELLSQLSPEARYQDGRVKVDQWMRAPVNDPALLGSVIVLGDAAAYDEGDGELLPATAQVAGQAGAYVARILSRGFDLETTPPLLPCIDPDLQDTCDVFYDPQLTRWLQFRGLDFSPPFKFLNLGMLAYTGGGEALSQVQIGDVPLLSIGGSVSYLLWRSVYLMKQVATRNRVLVTFDWWKSQLFGRDITRL